MGDAKNYWSECGQVFFCDGKGYGLTDTLQTICLGNEDDIKDIERHQQKTWNDGSHKKIPYRNGAGGKVPQGKLRLLMSGADDIAENDEHNTGGNDLTQSA